MTLRRTRLPTTRAETRDLPTQAIQTDANETRTTLNGRGGPPLLVGPVTFIAGGSQRLNHKLGRVPVEFTAIDVTGGYGAFQRTAVDGLTITIKSQNACTATFRVA